MAEIDFFLSFNSTDRNTADLVYQTVTGAGFSCFYQHQDIPGGANFVHRMVSGLEQAKTMLALFSPAYFESKYAKAELNSAFAGDPLNEKPSILPLLIRDHDIPKPFNAFNYIDCRQLSVAEIQSTLLSALASSQKESVSRTDPRIPETNNGAAARKLLDDLEIAYGIFLSQCEVRDALVDAMCERNSGFELVQYELFIARFYDAMTPDERSLHHQIRAHTVTIEKLNRHALYCVEASPDFRRTIPGMETLREHLKAWIEKFERIFEADPSVGVLYVGVAEDKPFPSGIEAEIYRYIENKPRA